MGIRLTQLQCKEVICVSDGRRLGYIEDVEVEIPEGNIHAIVVQGCGRAMGLVSSRDCFRIPWHCIRRIGPDIVLVEADADACRVSRPKGRPAVPGLGKIH